MNYQPATGVATPTVAIAFTDAAGTAVTLPSTTTTTSGSFSIDVSVPSTAATGPGVFSATDSSGTAATASFYVRPSQTTASIAPSSGVPGTSTTLTGSGFAANEPLTVTLTQGTGPTVRTVLVAGTATMSKVGQFTVAITIPGNSTAGSASITVQDRDGNSASAAITIVAAAPTLDVTPTNVTRSSPVTLTGAGFATAQPVTLTFAQGVATSLLVSTTTDSAGTFSATATIPSTALTGTATISATDQAGDSAGARVRVSLPNNGPTTLYFAEGFTGLARANGAATFDETLAVLNANPFTATVNILYLIQDGTPMTVTRVLRPNTMLRESVKKDVGVDRTVAAVVSSPEHVTAERVISRVGPNDATLGASTSLGNPNLGSTFYFPAGAAGPTYMEYLALVNPGDQDANVTLAYVPESANATVPPDQLPGIDGGVGNATAPMSVTMVVPARGRATHRVGNDEGGDTFAADSSVDTRVGMMVTSDRPIMAERVLYFGDGDGSGKFGSTTQAGIMTAVNQYIFAYGSAGGTGLAQRTDDPSDITVLNPAVSPMSATVVAQFADALGQTLGVTSVVVGPGTRQTLDANAVVSNTARVYSTVLTSSSPFVAEKAQYLGGSPDEGAYPGFALEGAPAGVTSVAFPDLSLVNGSGTQLQQTVFLYNPTSSPITVTGTYYSDHGSLSVDYRVAPGTITTVDVNTDATALHTQALGGTFVVTSQGAQDSFVATNVANTVDGRSYTGTQGSLRAL